MHYIMVLSWKISVNFRQNFPEILTKIAVNFRKNSAGIFRTLSRKEKFQKLAKCFRHCKQNY